MLAKVLIVDDSTLIHQMYRLILSRYGCRVISATDGLAALNLLSEDEHQDVQLIILDINMPVMNGVQFMEKARSLGIPERVPIMVVTTEGKESDALNSMALGARAFLKKPFDPSQLHQMVEELLGIPHPRNGGRPISGTA